MAWNSKQPLHSGARPTYEACLLNAIGKPNEHSRQLPACAVS